MVLLTKLRAASRCPKTTLAVGTIVTRSRARPSQVSLSTRDCKQHCFVPQNDVVYPLSPYASLELSRNAESNATSVAAQYDFLVIGSGIAGLTYALKVAKFGSVAVITKEGLSDGCTVYAQGGVCAVLDPLDSVEDHANDTIVAGNFLNDPRAVHTVCSEGPECVLDLVEMGAMFTCNATGSFHLTKEGGHSARRIVHAADTTGAEISRTLVAATRAHPRIDVFENHMCIDLCVEDCDGVQHCMGADILNCLTGDVMRFVAFSTMMSTGGAGQLYPCTTNPAVSTGDGVAAAWRAGAAIGNMEFVQFHPTALYDPSAEGRTFLISEAVRGEGGQLFNSAGERFMHKYDSRLELAPRDVVARAIEDQMIRTGEQHVWLDISHVDSDIVLSHFPAIAATCAERGIDITRDRIPVRPAQHFMCGGVQTGLNADTSIAGLFACGEAAHTGLHGANRLASNSLLEGLVFGARAVEPSVAHAELVQHEFPAQFAAVAKRRLLCARSPMTDASREWAAQLRRSVQEAMQRHAGIRRTNDGLLAGLEQMESLQVEVKALESLFGPSREVLEVHNLLVSAKLVLKGALLRKESRGLHYRTDYPESSNRFLHTTVLECGDDPAASSARHHAMPGSISAFRNMIDVAHV